MRLNAASFQATKRAQGGSLLSLPVLRTVFAGEAHA